MILIEADMTGNKDYGGSSEQVEFIEVYWIVLLKYTSKKQQQQTNQIKKTSLLL